MMWTVDYRSLLSVQSMIVEENQFGFLDSKIQPILITCFHTIRKTLALEDPVRTTTPLLTNYLLKFTFQKLIQKLYEQLHRGLDSF